MCNPFPRPLGVVTAEAQRDTELRDRVARLLRDAYPPATFSEYETRKAADWAKAVRHAIQRQQEDEK